MDDCDAVEHYHRRLISKVFGGWVLYAAESYKVRESADRFAENYLLHKINGKKTNTDQQFDLKHLYQSTRLLKKWILYCECKLKSRGKYLIGKIAREKILLAKGYRSIRQFYEDENTMREYGIQRIRSFKDLNDLACDYRKMYYSKKMRQFIYLLLQRCQKKNQRRSILCDKDSSISKITIDSLKQWKGRKKSVNFLQLQNRRAIKYHRQSMLLLSLGVLRENRRRNRIWRQLYNCCDNHYYEQKVGEQGFMLWKKHHIASRSYHIPRMYRALQFWKYTQGHKVLQVWRAHLTEKLFRSRSMKKLHIFCDQRRIARLLHRWRYFVKYRQEYRSFSVVKYQQSLPVYQFYAQLRYLLRWRHQKASNQRQQQLQHKKAQKFYLKKQFHEFIHQRMNQYYFPVIIRRQAAYHRRACFHDGWRKLAIGIRRWNFRIQHGNRAGILVQQENIMEALHHWKTIKLSWGLRKLFQYSRKKVAFRFLHHQTLVQIQPHFQRHRILSRCFQQWRNDTMKSLQLKRQRIREVYELAPLVGISPPAADSRTARNLTSILPPVSAETKLLRDQVRKTLAPVPSTTSDTTDLIRAMPKPLSTHFPHLPSEIKYGSVAATSNMMYLYPESKQHQIPSWLMTMSLSSSTASSIASSSLCPSIPVPAIAEDKHWSNYVQHDLFRVPSQPLSNNIAKALQPIIQSDITHRPLSYRVHDTHYSQNEDEENRKLAKALPRDGRYQSRPTPPIYCPISNARNNDYEVATSQHSVISMSDIFPPELLRAAKRPFTPSVEVQNFIGIFLQRIQAYDPQRLKQMLRKSPEKRQIFLEIRSILHALCVEQVL